MAKLLPVPSIVSHLFRYCIPTRKALTRANFEYRFHPPAPPHKRITGMCISLPVTSSVSPERVRSAIDETEIKADIGRVSLELDNIKVLLFLRLLSLSLLVLVVGCWEWICFNYGSSHSFRGFAVVVLFWCVL